MKFAQPRLVRHLVIAVVLKLLVLALLWWGFVRDTPVDLDAPRVAAHIGTEQPQPGAPP